MCKRKRMIQVARRKECSSSIQSLIVDFIERVKAANFSKEQLLQYFETIDSLAVTGDEEMLRHVMITMDIIQILHPEMHHNYMMRLDARLSDVIKEAIENEKN